MALGVVLGVHRIGVLLGGEADGLAAAALLSLSPYFANNARRCMLEVPLTFFVVGAVLADLPLPGYFVVYQGCPPRADLRARGSRLYSRCGRFPWSSPTTRFGVYEWSPSILARGTKR
jgi:hypothetical protein